MRMHRQQQTAYANDLNSEVGPLEDKTYTLIIKSEFAYGPTITHQFNYSNSLDESFVVNEEY